MKHIKEREVVREEYVYKRTCDICGQDTKIENKNENTNYQYSEVNINAKIGSCYPDGDCRTYYELDFCGECFTDKIRPLIEKSFNLKFKRKELY